MGRVLARVLTRCLLASPTVLVVAFAACSSATNQTTTGSGSGGSTTASTGSTGGVTSSGTTSSSTEITVGSTTSTGGPGTDGGCGTMVVSECHADSDCDDGDPSTIDTCIIANPQSEFPTGSCVHVACDGGPSCSMQAVDPTCNVADAGVVYPPFVTLTPPDVPATCSNGFQLCDAEGAMAYVINSKSPSGSQALTLDLDFATYTAPDGLLITGIDGNCKQYVLFDSCRIKTADKAEGSYTNGMMRPQDVAIRQFHLTLKPGTTQLTFDFSRVVSPMYVQVLGLCDFTLPPAASVGWFALVP